MAMSVVCIQQRDPNGFWKNIRVTHIQTSDEEIMILGNPFRILVNDEVVYQKGGGGDGLGQEPCINLDDCRKYSEMTVEFTEEGCAKCGSYQSSEGSKTDG